MGDTPRLSKSAKLYQERRAPEDVQTHRLPGPRLDLAHNPIHTIPISPPYPLPDALQMARNHPPDAGNTTPWPHGEEELS